MKVISSQLATLAAAAILIPSFVVGEQWAVKNGQLAVLSGRTKEFEKRYGQSTF